MDELNTEVPSTIFNLLKVHLFLLKQKILNYFYENPKLKKAYKCIVKPFNSKLSDLSTEFISIQEQVIELKTNRGAKALCDKKKDSIANFWISTANEYADLSYFIIRNLMPFNATFFFKNLLKNWQLKCKGKYHISSPQNKRNHCV